jgi:RHS repeat-associated protein
MNSILKKSSNILGTVLFGGMIFLLSASSVLSAASFEAASNGGHGVLGSSHQRTSVDSSTGSFSHSYPIIIPQGRSGMQPSLALSYNSQNTSQSILGHGWSLGLPSISRSSKTGVQDLFTAPTFYSSFAGELTPIALTDGLHGEYAPIIETGSFLVHTYNDDDSWTIADKQGQTYQLGSSDLSRQEDDLDASHISKWMLDRRQDLNGNFIRYAYEESGNQIYPSEIFYTGNDEIDGVFRVEILREERGDVMLSFRQGFRIDTTERISEINIYANDEVVRTVNLGYVTGSNGTRSLIETINETANGPHGDIAMPETSFDYSQPGTAWEYVEDEYDFDNGEVGLNNFRVFDLNADGFEDMVYAKDSAEGVMSSVYLHNGDASGWTFYEDIEVPLEFTSEGGWSLRDMHIIDLNGDGAQDLIRRIGDSEDQWVYMNQGGEEGFVLDETYTEIPPLGTNRKIVDVNGDGLRDIAHWTFGPLGSETYIHNADGTGWTLDEEFIAPIEVSDSTNHFLLDLNNDGLTDLFRPSLGFSGDRGVHLNRGDGTWELADDYLFDFVVDGLGEVFVDMNADGYPDLVRWEAAWDEVRQEVHINNGDNTGWHLDESIVMPVSLNPDTTVFDANGDGMMDIIRSDERSDELGGPLMRHTDSYIFNGSPADILETINHGTGSSTTIEYTPSALLNDGAPLNPDLPYAQNVVTKRTDSDGMGAEYITSYVYEGGYFYYDHEYEKQLSGFHIVTTEDGAGNISKQYFHQGNETNSALGEQEDTKEKIGRIYRSEAYDGAGNLYAASTSNWQQELLAGGDEDRHFVYLEDAVSRVYDGTPTHTDTATSYIYDFTTGNTTEVTQLGFVTAEDDGSFVDIPGDELVSVTEYVVTEVPRLIGLPSKVQKTDNFGTILREEIYIYDNQMLGAANIGNLTAHWQRISPGFSVAAMKKTSYEYDDFGNVVASIDAEGGRTEILMDGYNLYPSNITNALGHTSFASVDLATGQTIQTIDVNGVTEEWDVDSLGRPIEYRKSSQEDVLILLAIEEWNYDDVSMPRSVEKTTHTNELETISSIDYFDGLGRKIQSRTQMDAPGIFSVTDTRYDALSRAEHISVPHEVAGLDFTEADLSQPQVSTVYDALSRPVTVSDTVGEVTTVYDGSMRTVTDEEEKVHAYHTDAAGRLVQVDEYYSSSDELEDDIFSTLYTYNVAGDLLKITDAEDNIRNFEYDLLGRRTMAEDLHDPSDLTFGVYQYRYNKLDALTRMMTPNGDQIKYSYDALNRPTKEQVQDGGWQTHVLYKYDEALHGVGKLSSVLQMDQDTGTQYVYEPGGNVDVQSTYIDGTFYHVTMDYDFLGREVEKIYPNGDILATTYNAQGIDTLTLDGTEIITNISYNANGQSLATDYGNGTSTTNTYSEHQRNWLQNKISTSPSETLQDYDYDYDGSGNLNFINDSASLETAHRVDYLYDDLHRLTNAVANEFTDPENNYDYDYSYDILGNMTSNPMGSFLYEGTDYANPHAATEVAGETWTYDQAGNILSNTVDTNYLWNHRNEMVEFTRGVETTQYLYNESGSRLVKTAPDGSRTFYIQGVYVIDEATGAEEINISANGSLVFTKKIAIDTTERWVLVNHLGSTAVTTDELGELVTAKTYDPYGNPHTTVYGDGHDADSESRYSFSGKERDAESNLMYFEARYLNTEAGRFVSQDPVMWSMNDAEWFVDPQMQNSYSYATNNPTKYLDPDGRKRRRTREERKARRQARNTRVREAIRGALTSTFATNKPEALKESVRWAPIAGDVIDVVESVTGKDIYTGETLPPFERSLTVVALAVPIVPGKVVRKAGLVVADLVTKLDDVSVSSFGSSIYRGSRDLTDDIQNIVDGNIQSHDFYRNDKGLLPEVDGEKYYQEYKIDTPGWQESTAGPERIIIGENGETFYTPDHYKSFERLD